MLTPFSTQIRDVDQAGVKFPKIESRSAMARTPRSASRMRLWLATCLHPSRSLKPESSLTAFTSCDVSGDRVAVLWQPGPAIRPGQRTSRLGSTEGR